MLNSFAKFSRVFSKFFKNGKHADALAHGEGVGQADPKNISGGTEPKARMDYANKVVAH